MAKSPKKLNIRTYHVGFGDCFLLSFEYGSNDEKHVLVDLGSTGLPDGTPKTRVMDIAKDIKARSGGKLTAVVATHRHKDHISGAGVNVYKVGHHGSLNATPKSLWSLFKNRSKDARDPKRLKSLMSTMEHKHGSEASHTEVPRAPLVSALRTNSELFSTQSSSGNTFFHDTSIKF